MSRRSGGLNATKRSHPEPAIDPLCMHQVFLSGKVGGETRNKGPLCALGGMWTARRGNSSASNLDAPLRPLSEKALQLRAVTTKESPRQALEPCHFLSLTRLKDDDPSGGAESDSGYIQYSGETGEESEAHGFAHASSLGFTNATLASLNPAIPKLCRQEALPFSMSRARTIGMCSVARFASVNVAFSSDSYSTRLSQISLASERLGNWSYLKLTVHSRWPRCDGPVGTEQIA